MINDIRANLKKVYDEFVEKYGLMNSQKNRRIILKHPQGQMLLASVEVKTDTGYIASDILTKSVTEEAVQFRTDNVIEALSHVLGTYGYVALDKISEITDLEPELIIEGLGDLIYLDPAINQWVTDDKYLSGNVHQKLLQADAAHRDNPEDVQIARSLKAIQEVQVQQIPWALLGDSLNLGERWLPMELYSKFAEWLFQIPIVILYLPSTDTYKTDAKSRRWQSHVMSREYVVSPKGARNNTMYGDELLEHALHNTTPHFTYTNSAGEKIPDNDSIQLANEKIEDMRHKFTEWLQELPADEKDALVDTYNNTYNCYVIRKYNGSHIMLPDIDMEGLKKTYGIEEIRGPQKDVAWRIIQDNGAIVDWEVGSGKSQCIVVAAHEMKRMKIRNKPCILCLKANVADIARLYRISYPKAKILAPSEKDFEKVNRQRLFHEIKNNDWDCVIMTHDQFGKIPQSDQIQKEILQEEVDNLDRDLDTVSNAGYNVSRTMRKDLEQRKQTLLVKLKTIQYRIASGQDDINFDQMGIDHLLIDECFPYETLILTDIGWLSIGEIVTERKEVKVLSFCSESRTFELMPVTNWLKKPLVKKLVKVTHEYGEFTCTEDHKVWTREYGYVKAGHLTREHTLVFKDMQELWEEANITGTEELLQQDMYVSMLGQSSSKKTQRGDVDMRMVQDQTCNKQQEQVLQYTLQDVTSESIVAYKGAKTPVWERVPEISSRRQESSTMFRKNASQQSNAQSGNSSKDDKEYAGQNLSITRRKWSVNKTSETTMSGTRVTGREYGMGDTDQTCMGKVPISTKPLQSGYRYTGEEVKYRSGWENTSDQKVEVPGQTQNRNIGSSRVVSVEVYQRASDAGYGFSDSSSDFVYDLTVEKNHNYFAAGVLVSNCHRFKNLMFTTRHDRVAGIGNQQGSQKALNMLFAIRTLQKRFDSDLQCTFLSGTPISNSLTEMYLLFKYLRPKELARQNIMNFDAWAAVFAKKTTNFEFSVTNQIQSKERFRHFIKVPELALFYNEIADYKTNKSINIDKPEMIEELVPLAPTDDQKEFIQNLIRYAKTGMGEYIGRDDLTPNGPGDTARMLIATNYAKKMSTDMRLINPDLYDDHPNNKISVCCKRLSEQYHKFSEQKGVQLVFCDLGVPDNKGYDDGDGNKVKKWTVYQAMKDKLVEEYELPADEIVFIHDYNEKTRGKLFKQVNDGVVRIMIGSTDKAGTGVNVQQRVVTIHDLDIPWKSTELEQRGGRGARQGNWVAKLYQDNKVYRYIYATEQSLDTYKFTLLKNKQTFISQMKTNELQVRSIDEGSFDEANGMNFAEYIAVLSGDTTLLEKAKIDKKLAVLENLKVVHYREIHNNKYLLEHKISRKAEVDEVTECVQRDWDQYSNLITRDAAGVKNNPVVIDAIQDQVRALEIQIAAEEMAKELVKQECKLLKQLKMKTEKVEETEEEPKSTLQDPVQLIGSHLVEVWKTWKPKIGETHEKLGQLLGFNLYIQRVTATEDGLTARRGYTGPIGSNIMFSNQLYAQHTHGGLKYLYNHGIPSRENSKLAARIFINAIARSEQLLAQYKDEQSRLAVDIVQLSKLDAKPFSKENEIKVLHEESKRLEQEITSKLNASKMEPV